MARELPACCSRSRLKIEFSLSSHFFREKNLVAVPVNEFRKRIEEEKSISHTLRSACHCRSRKARRNCCFERLCAATIIIHYSFFMKTGYRSMQNCCAEIVKLIRINQKIFVFFPFKNCLNCPPPSFSFVWKNYPGVLSVPF